MLVILFGKEKITIELSAEDVTLDKVSINPPHAISSEATIRDLKIYLYKIIKSMSRLGENGENGPSQIEIEEGERLQNVIPDPLEKEIVEMKLILSGKVLNSHETKLGALNTSGPVTKMTLLASQLNTTAPLPAAITHPELAAQAEKESRLIRDDLTDPRKGKSKRSRTNGSVHRAPNGFNEYGFHRISTLAGLPNESRARVILEKLANDPGIHAVMQKYKFHVYELSELYPEGYVGVSDVCVMGLNQNHGAKILLRLRTDDLAGFRKYLSIKKVLYHELAHNIYSEHDGQFYALMRAIEKDANDLSWEKSRGRTLNGTGGSRWSGLRESGPQFEDDFDEEDIEEKVYRLGGGDSLSSSAAVTGAGHARALAGEAALLRYYQQQQQRQDEMKNITTRIVGGSERSYNEYVRHPPSSVSKDDVNTINEEKLGSFVSAHSIDDRPMQIEENNSSSSDDETKGSKNVSPSVKNDVSFPGNDKVDILPVDIELASNSRNDYFPADVPSFNQSILTAVEPTKEGPEPDSQTTTADVSPESSISFGDKLLELKSRILSITQEAESLLAVTSTDSNASNLSATAEKIDSMELILTELIQTIVSIEDIQAVHECLKLIHLILTNLQSNPNNPKYQKVNQASAKFQKTFFPPERSQSLVKAIQLFYLAGFEDNYNTTDDRLELQYKRRDYGLLYLTKSIVEQVLIIFHEIEGSRIA